jgi:hypothetical protein
MTGTIRANRKGIPPVLKQARPAVGQAVFARATDVYGLSFKEKISRKPVLAISTRRQTAMGVHKRKVKQTLLISYNQHMGRVDLHDQMLY